MKVKQLLKGVIISLFIILVGIQFVPTKYNQQKKIPLSDIQRIYKIPKNVLTTFKRSCYDCHSNNTKYPWYSEIQPIRAFMEHHIEEAKEELNFSEFGNYSSRRKRSKLRSIVGQLKEEEMPLFSYTLLHGDAALSKKEKEEIIEWISTLSTSPS